jgi:hypothetical protein
MIQKMYYSWEHITKTSPKGTGFDGVYWIDRFYDSSKWRAGANTVMNSGYVDSKLP